MEPQVNYPSAGTNVATGDQGSASLAGPEAMAYLQVGSTLLNTWSQAQAAQDQFDAIQKALESQKEQMYDRASVKVGERAAKAREEQAQITNLQAMANIGGTTAQEQLQESQIASDRATNSINRNLDLSLQRARESAASNMAGVQSPNYGAAALKIGGTYMKYREQTD